MLKPSAAEYVVQVSDLNNHIRDCRISLIKVSPFALNFCTQSVQSATACQQIILTFCKLNLRKTMYCAHVRTTPDALYRCVDLAGDLPVYGSFWVGCDILFIGDCERDFRVVKSLWCVFRYIQLGTEKDNISACAVEFPPTADATAVACDDLYV